jgi:hypothetical protein
MKPNPSVTTPEGWPSVWVMVKALPAASITQTWVVWALSAPPVLKRGKCAFSPARMRAAAAAA